MEEVKEVTPANTGPAPAEVAAGTTATTTTTIKKKHEEKYRKKDPRSWENISKAIANLENAEKTNYIQQKYVEVYNELRKVTGQVQALTKEYTVLQKERDHSKSELVKIVVSRSRLENLCRELQKQNKQMKDENMAKIKEEEERRKEVSVKFADKLATINVMMDENKEKGDKLREENLKMTAKLSELFTEFQKREEDISKMSQQLELERRYSQATLAKMELEIRAEKEISSKEKEELKVNLEKSEANCRVLLDTVKGLQDHIDVYKTQYDDFETTLSKSSKVFDNFKFEMTTMTKKINCLEKESNTWKSKFHDSMKAILDLTEIKRNQDMLLQSADKKNEQLQKLCRQLQVDRGNFLKLLKSNGIEATTTNSISELPEEPPQSPVKLTKKEKELQLLKDHLQTVQVELSRINDAEDKQESGQNQETTDQTPEPTSTSETISSPKEELQLTIAPTCTPTESTVEK